MEGATHDVLDLVQWNLIVHHELGHTDRGVRGHLHWSKMARWKPEHPKLRCTIAGWVVACRKRKVVFEGLGGGGLAG